MQTHTYELIIGGKKITAEFSDLVTHANGSVLLRAHETVVLVTAVMGKEQPDLSYLPLSVEFEERFYAAGAILGSRYGRREGRPSEEAILSARLIDRTIRPLFPQHLRREVQVVATVLAIGEEDPDVLSIIGTAIALSVSDIPWHGPVGAVRIAQLTNGVMTINPTRQEKASGVHFEIVACGQGGTINMIETVGNEVSEDDVLEVLTAATKIHDLITNWIEHIKQERGKEKIPCALPTHPEALERLFSETYAAELGATLFSGTPGKQHLYHVKERWLTAVQQALPTVSLQLAATFFETMLDEALHVGVIEFHKRPDGRQADEIRPLFAKAGGISPVLHGSGIFYRGSTHILSVLTLGGPGDVLSLDTIGEQASTKRFMHHYNFPPYSVGETGRIGGFNRRMIGHGALAEKALQAVIPPQEIFPYTIRLVSETLSSNGSSSMGSVCASTLALLDGGVPIKKPVAGIASGVMIHGKNYVILTDIQGPEDEHGDMDLKVAGTDSGITAMQMDVKVDGISLSLLREALEAARQARLHILTVMATALPAPRETVSPHAPEIIILTIQPEQIGLVIGSGGKTINKIKAESGVDDITIEDDGRVFITGKQPRATAAATMIQALTHIYAVGDIVTGPITKIAPFGIFIKIDDRHGGLVHISEIAPSRLETIEGVFTVGETITAKVVKIEDGKIGLSIKAADPDFVERRGINKA